MDLRELRKRQREYHKTCKYSIDWNCKSPYTYFKSRLYMEGAALIVWILQYTKVRPNTITIIYGMLGVFAGIVLPLKPLIAIPIIFFKGILDLVDGHLARLTGSVTNIGGKLDYWAGKTGTIVFYIGLLSYIIYNKSVSIVILLLILTVLGRLDGRARTVDLICLALLIDVLI